MLNEMLVEFTQEFSAWQPGLDQHKWVRARHSTFSKEKGGYGWWHIQTREESHWRPEEIKLTGYDLRGELYVEFYDIRHPDSLDQLKAEILKLESVPAEDDR